MVAVIDYDTGNLRSVCNALERLGATYEVTADHSRILSADRVLMPGVGEASSAMRKLRERGLDTLIPRLTQPVLGICIGMQLMCDCSEEGDARCLGIFPTRVRRLTALPERGVKVPHMGWNSLTALRTPLFDGVAPSAFVYFVHSFAADICPSTIAQCDNGRPFSAALNVNNFYGMQFHPEKSGDVGQLIINNFLTKICAR